MELLFQQIILNYTADTPTDELPTLNVRLSTSGVSTIDKPQFIVTIPKGFKVTGHSLILSNTVSKFFDGNFKGTNSFNNNDYSVESLGTNSNGEEIYSVKLNFNPSESDNKDLGLQFKLAVDSSASTKGNHKYDSNTPLVTELASDGQSTAGTATITVNGTTYDVVKSSNATNVSYYINDAQIPTFTGAAFLNNFNNNSYTSESTIPSYTFRLSTNGDSTVKNPKFIVMIPAGFTATTDDFSFANNYSGKISTQYLGEANDTNNVKVQFFEISLAGNTPNYRTGQSINGTVKLTINPNMTGQYTYTVNGIPLVSEETEYAIPNGDANHGGGSTTITINGKTYNVVKNATGIDDGQPTITYAVNQAVKPTFTGTATLGNLSNGTFVSADGTNYNTDTPSTKLPTLNVRLSTNGPTTITNPQFIVTIPKGFKATGNSLISSDTVSEYFDTNFKGTNSFSNSDYTVTSLGTNSNGEEVYSVKLNFNPSESDNKDLGLQFQLSLDPSAKGKFTYNSSTPLVTELASDGQNTAGTATITVNDTTYDVVKSSNATNLSYYINDAHIPSFTGTANLLDASGHPIAAGTVYSGTQVPKYTFRLSTSGDSTVQNPKFIVMIPAGFTATTDSFKFNYGAYKGTAKVEKLDGKGPNGEQLFEVTLSGATPNFQTAQVSGSIALTPNFTGDNGGSHTYSNSVAPLISEFATDAQSPWGTYTFNTGTGTVKVVQSPQTVNWLDAGNKAANSSASVNYIIQVGKDKLDNDAYTISKVDPNKPMVVPHEGKASDKAGYEELSFVFTPKGELKDGQYFDVHLGLPGQNGVELYDKTLGNNLPIYAKDGTQVGTAYKMGTYYRVVFNSNAASVTTGNNHPSFTLHLSWGNAQSQQPSISTDQSSSNTTNLGQVYVYQKTSDLSKDGTKFPYSPTKDVQIGDYTFTSGLHIQGQYVYDGQYLDANKETSAGISWNVNRTWTPNNGVTVNANWENDIGFEIATGGATDSSQNTYQDHSKSNTFDLTVSVGKNDEFNYNWKSADDIKQQIQKDLNAWYKTNKFDDPVTGTDNQIWLKATPQEVKQQDIPDVTVSVDDVPTTDGTIKKIYHIEIINAPTYKLKGSIIPLVVTAKDPFTMPSDINSYEEDLAQSATVDKDNYENDPDKGAKTSNETLQNALINTSHPEMLITNNKGDTIPFPKTLYWSNWKAGIKYDNSLGVNNSADASNYRTATLEFYNDNDPANPVLIDGTTIDYRGASDTPIDFANATSTLADLISKGYTLEKVEDPDGNAMTPGPDGKLALSDYPYGNLVNSSNIFKVYLHYTDVQSISTSQSVSTSISNSYSIQRSESRSESLSISEATSGSISRSLSNSIRQSESTSRSLSQSESLSHSTSQSESLSNSLSQSESLSNSLSQSESLSNSLSQSESLSNSLSQSESLSNSLSQSESLSNSLSQSESLSNSLSQSESLSNSLSQSESLSNSLNQSESLSNSLSESESLSNSLSNSGSNTPRHSQGSTSQSGSLSNSLSESEASISNSISQSTSISTHSEVIESTSETNSNTNNSESINSTTNPSISRPAESVSEQTNVNITPEKQPAESTEQQVSAKKHRVRTNTRRKLPQTGASTNSSSLLGLLATAVGGLLGLRRKKNRKRRR